MIKKGTIAALAAAFSFGFAAAHIFKGGNSGAKNESREHPAGPLRSAPWNPEPAFKAKPGRAPALPEAPAAEAAGPEPTKEESEAIAELARRSQEGEYILESENPFTARRQRESVERFRQTVIPAVMEARERFLSGLELPPDKIARLTNHAAKIAEASWQLAPLLSEISTAKMEYNAKAKALLTPEQYQKYREYEAWQALEGEWKRFGITSAKGLSYDDLGAITRSLEELGIRERKSTTYLPYDPEPSSGNWLNGLESDLKQVMQKKIWRTEMAAADLAAIAERNQLSEAARATLALMIENWRASLARQMEGTANTQRELRDRFKAMHGSSATK